MTVVLDTNVLLDSKKDITATDAPVAEIDGALRILIKLTDATSDFKIGVTPAILQEYLIKNAIEDLIYRFLLDNNKIVTLKPVKISGGQKADLGKYVDADDQQFLLAAAAIELKVKKLFTRDPKTTKSASIQYCKKNFAVVIKLASSF
ncbi:hypothetical protein [Bdellovibrio bacteriovorus]|uniref:PIN domain-containing protein n=1 Tax=Bdellovibrio bacteriovorus TaxID=959 RepID=A0A1Z3N5R4_BDEBC|nr:hypothetical protein [Bdellovibrio bacteriovorus]ASD62809.1 hypothetical protein B9G79_04125 [Bdellovibrio bacteriovorus]